MIQRIHQLSPAIANQIAAGEVIERPASVVKELLENSLDAGSTSITIELGYGGLNQIKISDNGVGIIAEDLPLAVKAHATSKITKLDDLYAIESMGFRGEALASIASVAKVTISSKTAMQEHAMMLRVHESESILSPCARTIGTTIDVIDLFFNAPVRKRFLKNEKLEFQAIEMVIKRFALSAPNIAITLKHNGKQVLSLAQALTESEKLKRMTKIFGNAFMHDAIFLDVAISKMRLYGWLSGPTVQRSQNDRLWIYINQRMVKDKLINHALKQAYDGLLHPGRFPACLLYFTLDTREVDVNVHPTKHEVRFQQPRLVHDFLTSQLAKALSVSHAVPKESSTYQMTFNPPLERSIHLCEPYADAGSFGLSEMGQNWVVLNKRYIVLFIQQQPYIVDVIALQQQWLQERLAQSTLPLESRPLLVPIHYSLPQTLMHPLEELKEVLKQLGLRFELTSANNVIIQSIPIKVPYLDLHSFLDSIMKLEDLELDKLRTLLGQSQMFLPMQLSPDERMELNQFLLHHKADDSKKSSLFKNLSEEDCRNLLYV